MTTPLTTDGFISRASIIHEHVYDYSMVEYVNNRVKINIICCRHGAFVQMPRDHLVGKGCPQCGYERIAQVCRKKDFVERAKVAHGDKYDYSAVVYINAKTKVKIKCHKHGVFLQCPHNHINSKQGCPQCNLGVRNTDEFCARAEEIHGVKYNYSRVDYTTKNDKIKIVCPVHGDFWQSPTDHLAGKSCRACNLSITKQQRELSEIVIDFGLNVSLNNRDIIRPFELDLYIADANLAIELNGMYFHSYNNILVEDRYKHLNKLNMCRARDVRLIQVAEYEWMYKKEIVISRIKSIIGLLNHKIPARKCQIESISDGDYKQFIELNHLQGYRSASAVFALTFNGAIVACASFARHKEGWELIRFASQLNSVVVGGASKLLTHFIREIKPSTIVSFADLRYSTGRLYDSLGFEKKYESKPNYVYLKGRKVWPRQKFQKHKLRHLLTTFDSKLTEAQNMFNNGYRRMWDAGNIKYVLSVGPSA